MKKVIASIIVVIMLLIANVVYADYGIPGGVEYEAVITNEDGAEVEANYSSSLEVIPYGAIVTVQYEYDGSAYVEYNGSGYNVSLDDIEPVSDAEELLENLDTNQKEMYIWREGAYLYKGPSTLYGKLDEEIEIPVGTVVTIDNCSDVWGYVEYDGYNGWVYIYTSDEVAPFDMECSFTEIAYEKVSHYYTIDEISLSSTLDGENVVGTIPAGEHIDSYFYSEYPDPHGKTIYIKYNDIEGWYTIDEKGVYQDFSVSEVQGFTTSDADIFEELDWDDVDNGQGTGKAIATIPEGSFCNIIYYTLGNYASAIYVEYNGVEGWTYSGVSIDSSIWLYNNLELKTDAEIIDIETGERTGDVVESGTIVSQKFYYYNSDNKVTYRYIETLDESISGWAINFEFDMIWDEGYDLDYLREQYVDVTQFVTKEVSSGTEVYLDDSDEDYVDETEEKEEKIDSVFEDYMMYCVIGAVVVFIIAIIIIVAINKNKKKNKKEE